MATLNGVSFVDMRNINLKGGAIGSGVIRFAPSSTTFDNPGNWAANPIESTAYGLYINSAGSLVFSSLGTTTVLGAAGSSGGVPTWSQIYAGQATFTLTGTTWTIDNNTGNNDVLTITNTGAGSGDLIQITNAGTGKDINGTSSTWSVSATGVLVALSAQVTTNVIGSSGLTLSATGAGLVTIGANTNTITMAKATTFSSTITVTDGATTFISTSNVASNILATNNTITTFGASSTASQGQVVFRSTSLTTGTLLRLQLAESALTTGKYLELLDSTAVASVFTIAKLGATVIAGSAFATAALTLTAGDAVISSGKLLVTAASNAAAMVVFTNNTATSQSVFKVAGSGVFTGTTTTAFTTITPSGLTTGTALYIVAVGATTSVGVVDIDVSGALSSGSALRITSGTAAFTTGGKLIELTSTAAVAGNLLTATTTGAYTGTGMILVTAGAATTGVLVSIVSTTGLTSGSLLRATSSTAGAIATNGAISFVATGAFTNGASTLGFVHVAAASTVSGTIMSILGGAQTTGIALNITDPSTGMTSGSLLRVITASTGAVATNGIVSFQSTGAFTSTTIGFVNVIVSGAVAGTGIALQMSATSQTTGIGLRVDQTNTTTGYSGALVQFTGSHTTGGTTLSVVDVTTTTGDAVLISSNALVAGTSTAMRIAHTTSVLGAGNSLLRLSSTSVDTGTTTGTLLDLSSAGGTTATMVLGTFSALTSGIGMKFNLNALTTGQGIVVAHTTTVIADTGSLVRISSTSVDTGGATNGVLLDLSSTASAAGVQFLQTYSGLTTGTGQSIITTGLTSGIALKVTAAAATLSTGFYIAANDGALNVFTIGANGHLTSNQTTAPTIVVTQQNGITAAAITAASSDTAGIITTTGTNNNGGTTILTITFNKTYTVAPKVVMIQGANASGSLIVPFVSSTTATTFVLTIPASASSGATPSWFYAVIA